MLLGLFVWFLVALPFLWPVYKHWRTAKEMVPIHDKAQDDFRRECDRLGIQCTKEFSDVYSTSFIRCDDKSERIAVYAGRSNRFSVIPYSDFFSLYPDAWFKDPTPLKGRSSRTQYVTTRIGNTSVTTKYDGITGFSARVDGYKPTITPIRNGVVCHYSPAFIFDMTESVGSSRIKKTKEFCELVDKEMGYICTYAFNAAPGQTYAEWKKADDELVRARANRPDPYGNYHLK